MRRVGLAFLAATALCTVNVQAEDWPQWRGPDGRRISTEQNLPVSWSGTLA